MLEHIEHVVVFFMDAESYRPLVNGTIAFSDRKLYRTFLPCSFLQPFLTKLL
jgi:hypothetical protein